MLLTIVAGSLTVRTPMPPLVQGICQKGISISGRGSRESRLWTVW